MSAPRQMSDEHWECFQAQQIYKALLSQGEYCPKESLHMAKLNADSAVRRLDSLKIRNDRKMVAAILLVIFVATTAVFLLTEVLP